MHKNFFLMSFFSLLLVLPLLFFIFRQQKAHWRIRQWKKSLNLQEHTQVFQRLYQQVNGHLLSQQARTQKNAPEYMYGEIEFISFIALLSLVKPDDKTVFYDLGCGTGKAVLACAMVFPVLQSVGIELFPELYFSACEQEKQLAALEHYSEQTKKIKFILGDFLTADLNKATLIFINSTTIFGPTWEKLCVQLNDLPHLQTVITTSRALIANNFSLRIRLRYNDA